jgi:hypothetical protein
MAAILNTLPKEHPMSESIDLYFWPTPNVENLVALEEMGLPYTLPSGGYGAGDQFNPDFLKIAPKQPHACDR